MLKRRSMYTDFYKLRAKPFQLTPDHQFYFDSHPHRKALAYLTYGLSQEEGFVVITGEVGAGKTILVNYLLSKLEGKSFVTGTLVTTQVDEDNLVRLVAAAFGVSADGEDKATLLGKIESFLIGSRRNGARALLIVDEAQNLSHGSLEELRMLSNFQMNEAPLLQTYLVGQPQFTSTLGSANLEQLRQRVIASYHLRPLDAMETRGYVEHRLRHVGWKEDPAITDEAFELIYQETVGVPRRTNLLCDRLLLLGFLEERHEIDGALVREVIDDLRREGLAADSVLPPAPLSAPKGSRPSAGSEMPAERLSSSSTRSSLTAAPNQLEQSLPTSRVVPLANRQLSTEEKPDDNANRRASDSLDS